MSYIELGAELGKHYTSEETAHIMALKRFRTVEAVIEYIMKLSMSIGLPVPNGLWDTSKLTQFIMGFHNGTVQTGRCRPIDAIGL